jgi:hypothetical protein
MFPLLQHMMFKVDCVCIVGHVGNWKGHLGVWSKLTISYMNPVKLERNCIFVDLGSTT